MSLMSNINRLFKRKVDFAIAENQMLSMGDIPSLTNPIPRTRYRCRIIKKNRGMMTLAVCILKDAQFGYTKDGDIGLSYDEFMRTYVFTGKIENIFARLEIDKEDTDLFQMYLGEDILGRCELLIVSIIITSIPKEYERRDYVRHYGPPWKIYFKVREQGSSEDDESVSLVSEAQRKILESGFFETKDDEYCVLGILDIGGGGFRSYVAEEVSVDTTLDCVIKIDEHEYQATGIVLEYIMPNQMRVQFTHISTVARNAILKNILALEQKKRRRV